MGLELPIEESKLGEMLLIWTWNDWRRDQCMFGMLFLAPQYVDQISTCNKYLHFSKTLTSAIFASSSSFLKSLVFCARSFLSTSESFCCVASSEAVASSFGMRFVRSILLHAEIALWNLLSSRVLVVPLDVASSEGTACSAVAATSISKTFPHSKSINWRVSRARTCCC